MRTVSDLASLAASVNSRRVDSLGCRRHDRLKCHPLRASARDRIEGRLIPLGDPGQLWKGSPCLPHPRTSRKGGSQVGLMF